MKNLATYGILSLLSLPLIGFAVSIAFGVCSLLVGLCSLLVGLVYYEIWSCTPQILSYASTRVSMYTSSGIKFVVDQAMQINSVNEIVKLLNETVVQSMAIYNDETQLAPGINTEEFDFVSLLLFVAILVIIALLWDRLRLSKTNDKLCKHIDNLVPSNPNDVSDTE